MSLQVEIDGNRAQASILATKDQDQLAELVALELSLGQQQVRDLTLIVESEANISPERLQRLDYQPIAPGQYRKTLRGQPSVRLSITEKCNYSCFFCH